MPQVLTSNRLKIGEVLYWNAQTGWRETLAEATVLSDQDGEKALATAAEAVRRREVVAPYLFDVRVENGVIVPVKAREVIRARGPSVRPDLGKQAD